MLKAVELELQHRCPLLLELEINFLEAACSKDYDRHCFLSLSYFVHYLRMHTFATSGLFLIFSVTICYENVALVSILFSALGNPTSCFYLALDVFAILVCIHCYLHIFAISPNSV